MTTAKSDIPTTKMSFFILNLLRVWEAPNVPAFTFFANLVLAKPGLRKSRKLDLTNR